MFCINCGQEIADGSNFCTWCGSLQPNGVPTSGNPRPFMVKPPVATYVSLQAKQRNLLYVLLGLLFFGMLFTILPTFTVTALAIASKSYTMFDGVGFLTFLTVLMYLGAAAAILYPMLTKRAWRSLYLLPSKIVSCWTLLWFIIAWIGINDSLKRSAYSDLSSFGPNFAGWLLLLFSVAAVILSFVLSAEIKALGQRREAVQAS